MKKLKIFAIFLAICLVVLLFTGCSAVPENRVFSADDLPGKTIGVETGTTGADLARELEKTADGSPAAEVIGYADAADAIDALIAGELDCVIIDREPAKLFVARHDQLQILPDTFADEYYAFAVNKGKPGLTAALDKAFSELKEEGVIEGIVSGSLDYEPPEYKIRPNGILTAAVTADFAPYISKNTDGGYEGIDVDILNALCVKLGSEPEIKDMPFDKVIGSVRSGECDIGIGAISVTKERLQVVDFTESYARGVQVIITRKK